VLPHTSLYLYSLLLDPLFSSFLISPPFRILSYLLPTPPFHSTLLYSSSSPFSSILPFPTFIFFPLLHFPFLFPFILPLPLYPLLIPLSLSPHTPLSPLMLSYLSPHTPLSPHAPLSPHKVYIEALRTMHLNTISALELPSSTITVIEELLNDLSKLLEGV
jgi:hypothetical protein